MNTYTKRNMILLTTIFYAVLLVTPQMTSSFQSSIVPQISGQWSQVYDWPVVAVHMVLLPNGKVLVWDDTSDDGPGTFYHIPGPYHIALWNPTTNECDVKPVADTNLEGQDLFCAAHTLLPNGNVMAVTGVVGASDHSTQIYDWRTDKWVRQAPLNFGRYYPSATSLDDGGVLVVGGSKVSGNPFVADPANLVPEVFRNGKWSTLPEAKINFGPEPRGFYNNTTYFPWTQMAPNGHVFYAGPESVMRYIDTHGSGHTSEQGHRDGQFRDYGSYAMYDVGKILVIGGGESLKTAYTIDINSSSPKVKQTSNMAFGRRQQNLTILADGQVLATGGNSAGTGPGALDKGNQFSKSGAVYAAESWNPITGEWKTLASMNKPRQYHSTALLLPDGRVVVGGGACNACYRAGHNEINAEVFSPPYLFNQDGTPAERPQITDVPQQLSYGQPFTIKFTNTSRIIKVHLIKLGSVTHATNFDQRLIPLNFSQSNQTVSVAAPNTANIAPPGYYMLFIVSDSGTPSIAKMIQVGGNPNPVPPVPPVYRTTGQIKSIQSYNYPSHYIRHADNLGFISPVASNSSQVDKKDASFRIVPGLANNTCVSLESVNYPGHFLRHQDQRIKLHKNDSSSLFKNDSTFCIKNGLWNLEAASFESYNYPGHFIRHRNDELWIDPRDSTEKPLQDATFKLVTAWDNGQFTSGLQYLPIILHP